MTFDLTQSFGPICDTVIWCQDFRKHFHQLIDEPEEIEEKIIEFCFQIGDCSLLKILFNYVDIFALRTRKKIKLEVTKILSPLFSAESGMLLKNCAVIYRLLEIFRSEKTHEIIKSIFNLPLPNTSLNYVPKCHIYSSSKYPQGWWLNHLPREAILMQDIPSSLFIIQNDLTNNTHYDKVFLSEAKYPNSLLLYNLSSL